MSTATTSAPAKRLPTFMPFVMGAGILVSLYLVFWYAPSEKEMGEVYRIFFFHVASAMGSLMCIFGCSLLSIGYLVLRRMRGMGRLAALTDRVAVSMAEIGVLLGVVVLVTGPLWAKPAWGTFWTWEPRLTLMLLTIFLFVGYLVLRAYAAGDEAGKRLSAGIASVGAPAAYFIHIAVEKWGGNHPTVIYEGGGGLKEAGMSTTFAVTVSCMLAFMVYLIYMRYQHHKLRDDTEDLFLELSELEDARK